MWVAHPGDEVVGAAALLELSSRSTLVDSLVVREDCRGRGVGAELLRHVLATRRTTWWLECREKRIAFYRRLGFTLVNRDDVPKLVRARVGFGRTGHSFSLSTGRRPRSQ